MDAAASMALLWLHVAPCNPKGFSKHAAPSTNARREISTRPEIGLHHNLVSPHPRGIRVRTFSQPIQIIVFVSMNAVAHHESSSVSFTSFKVQPCLLAVHPPLESKKLTQIGPFR
jgi:hypothetical protein